jgi:hypothetical protein
MPKTGFELSLWSSHGELTSTKVKSQKAINAAASANFDKEMKRTRTISASTASSGLIYTDPILPTCGSASGKLLFVDQDFGRAPVRAC